MAERLSHWSLKPEVASSIPTLVRATKFFEILQTRGDVELISIKKLYSRGQEYHLP